MVVALNIAAVRKGGISTGLSPLAELLACLHVIAEPDHHPESRGWTDRINGRMTEQLRSDLFRFAPLWARYRFRLMYPLDHQLDRGLGAELDAMTSLPDDVFIPLAANAIHGRAFTFGSAAEVRDSPSWVRDCEQRSFNRGDLAHALMSDPGRFRRDLSSVLAECAIAFFHDEWESTRPRLEAAGRSLRARIDRDEPMDVLTSLSGIASARSSTDTVFFDKLQSAHGAVGAAGLIAVPSLRGWPHVMVKLDPGLPVVVQYPAQDDTRGPSAQSQDDLRRRLLVLAEPGRWELCRHLIGESITTTELAVRTSSTKSAVSRHLRLLREAGLISSQRDGRQVFHRLHPSVIVHLGDEVLRAIIR